MEHGIAPGLAWNPVGSGLEPPTPWVVRLASGSGMVAGILLLAWAWERSWARVAPTLPSLRGQPVVTVSLRLPAAPPRVAPGPSPSGLGHRRGTDSIDPERLQEALQHRLTGPLSGLADDPTAEVLAPPGGSGLEGLDLSLPRAPGGTGWAKGTGRDATRGGWKADFIDAERKYDRKLVVLLSKLAYFQPPYTVEEQTVPVIVLLTIGEDGVPIRARPLSGPRERYREALAAAMQWRFEPLGPHGLTAPHELTITFRPTWMKNHR